MNLTKSYLDELTYKINGAAIEVHRILGAGLLESVYHQCLKQELKLRGIKFQSELIVPIHYKGLSFDTQLRCDLFVENSILVELKAHESILPIHEAQTLTYLKLLFAPKGIIYNFNVTNLFKYGQLTFVNHLFRNLPA